jgi:hypothetical protein
VRALATLLVAAAFLFGVYHFYLKKLPTAEEGTSATQAISLTGVSSDLLQIAQAEQMYIATNGHCVSLEDLISSNSVSMSLRERAGYLYAVECPGSEFKVTARHASAPAGSPIRYPNLAIDSTMEIHEIN